MLLAPDLIRTDDSWTYAYSRDSDNDGDAEGPGGIRIVIPWTAPDAPDLPEGEVHIDLALDERLPEPPIWTLIPRPALTQPLVVRSASRELSLAWKLHWLNADSTTAQGPRPKDLYDAVILAEDTRTCLSSRLLQKALPEITSTSPKSTRKLDIPLPSQADWTAFITENPAIPGTADHWLIRLNTALVRHRPAER